MSTWKKFLIGLVFFGGLVGTMIYSVMDAQRYRCHVCIEYKGRSNCGTAAGEDVAAAYRTAADMACAMISSGVTERIACPNTPPSKKECRKR